MIKRLALCCVTSLMLACGSDDDDVAVDCSGAIPSYSDVSAFDKCSTCHASDVTGAARQGATVGVNFDSEEAATAQAQAAVHEVQKGFMPPASSGITLTDAEKTALYKWAECR